MLHEANTKLLNQKLDENSSIQNSNKPIEERYVDNKIISKDKLMAENEQLREKLNIYEQKDKQHSFIVQSLHKTIHDQNQHFQDQLAQIQSKL